MNGERLHIAHVLRKLDARAWGGTETHVGAITRHLRACGVDSDVHAPLGGSGEDGPFDAYVSVRRFKAYNPFVGSHEARERLWQTGGSIVSIEHPLMLARDKTLDLVHLHTAGRIGGGVRTAMRITGRRYVVSVHGPLAADAAFLEKETRARLRGTLDLGKVAGLALGARRVLDDAARVIVFNEAERRALEPRLGSRVVRMDHGVDIARFTSGDARCALDRWPALAGKRVVLQVARVCRQKNQRLAVEALARAGVDDAVLVLAGAETDPGYAKEVADAAAAAGVSDRVHFLGNVDPAHVPDLLALASVVIVPSEHEAFGLAVIEGWAAGRAVLFSRIAGMVDIADNLGDRSPALPADDASAWGNALGRTLRDERQRSAYAAEGQRIAKARYDWGNVTRSLAALYRDVLRAAPRVVAGT